MNEEPPTPTYTGARQTSGSNYSVRFVRDPAYGGYFVGLDGRVEPFFTDDLECISDGFKRPVKKQPQVQDRIMGW